MAEQTTHTLPLREEVPAKDKWHIEDIFSNDDAFTSALEACRTHIDALAAFKDHLGDSAETLCTYLTEKDIVPITTHPIRIIRTFAVRSILQATIFMRQPLSRILNCFPFRKILYRKP